MQGLVPVWIILSTSALVGEVPNVAERGLSSGAGRSATVALIGVAAGFGVGVALATMNRYLAFRVGANLDFGVNRSINVRLLDTGDILPLESPEVTRAKASLKDAEKYDVLASTPESLATILASRVTGVAALVLLLDAAWWIPIALLAFWYLTNLMYSKVAEKGLTVGYVHGADQLRRSDYLRETVIGGAAAKEIRVFGLADWFIGRYVEAWYGPVREIWRTRRSNRVLTGGVIASIVLVHALAFGLIGWKGYGGDIGVGQVVMYGQAILVTSTLGMLGHPQWILRHALTAAERITNLHRILDRLRAAGTAGPSASPSPAGTAPAIASPAAVRLDQVSFAYSGMTNAVLDEVDLRISPGQSVAIVGENGAGKTTLVKLMCGLYHPSSGDVSIDGRVSVIFQDFVHYELPLRENIGLGALSLEHDVPALEEVLSASGAEGFAKQLPHGWDTVLAPGYERGVDLSGGQWQKVALARALLAVKAGAGLLVLDEPTASLDIRSEAEVFDQLLSRTRGRVTTILVSHRFSTVRQVDRIVVLHGGRIVEDGTHDELIRSGGRYAEMFNAQARSFAAG